MNVDLPIETFEIRPAIEEKEELTPDELVDVGEVEAETDSSTIDIETETSSEKSKSKLAEIFTVVWPWERNKN